MYRDGRRNKLAHLKRKSGLGGKSQSDKFREMARQLEADDDEAAFDAKLKKLAKTKPDKEKTDE